MLKFFQKPVFALLATAAVIVSCDDDESKPDLRADLDYAKLSASTAYADQFKDASGNTTVDLASGNIRYKMFQALNYYSSSNTAANTAIDANKLDALYANTGSPFVDIATSSITVTGQTLNTSGLQLRNVTASSLTATEADKVRTFIANEFDLIATASASVANTATKGNAGKLGTYLVDAKGIERIQIIQKSLIGALQLDYIGNVLLVEGLNADNHSLVEGKNYSQLEHNWDEAYGLFTLNPIYALNYTADAKDPAVIEFGAGSYVWEYNRTNFNKMFAAFLKGRAAIVNNDRAELEAQATFIRTQIEVAIANAALGYLDKWTKGGDNAVRAHAIGEGLGFIYSLRFAKINKVDAAWSDGIINGLVGSENGFWDLDGTKISDAEDAIKEKFGI